MSAVIHYRLLWEGGVRSESTTDWETLLAWIAGFRETGQIKRLVAVETRHRDGGWPWVVVRSRRDFLRASLGVDTGATVP